MRKNGASDFTLLVASADTKPVATHDIKVANASAKLTVEYGDFSVALEKATTALKEAKKYAANEHQEAMLDGYIKS